MRMMYIGDKEIVQWVAYPVLKILSGWAALQAHATYRSIIFSSPCYSVLVNPTIQLFSFQILEVMSENLRSVSHTHALHALRQTPNRVRLVIHREDDEIYETIEVRIS